MQNATKRIRVSVSGRVQGVGFRFFVRDVAARHGLSGWVRNTPDGSVELEAQGCSDSLDSFTEAVQQGPPLARVVDIRISETTPTREAGFTIRR